MDAMEQKKARNAARNKRKAKFEKEMLDFYAKWSDMVNKHQYKFFKSIWK